MGRAGEVNRLHSHKKGREIVVDSSNVVWWSPYEGGAVVEVRSQVLGDEPLTVCESASEVTRMMGLAAPRRAPR